MIRAKAKLAGSKDAEKGGSSAPTPDSRPDAGGIASAKDAMLSGTGGPNGEAGSYQGGGYRSELCALCAARLLRQCRRVS